MGFLDELKRLTHPYEDEMEDDYDEDEDVYEDEEEPEVWQAAIRATVPPKTVDVNLEAFAKGRACTE